VTALPEIAPTFVEMAHRIVWCTAATVDEAGRPRTRILHPIWEFDGDRLQGWILTSPSSVKAGHLAAKPALSLTYWIPSQDTCTADCSTAWETTAQERAAGWNRFAEGPAPVGYDPSIIPPWTSPEAPEFGVLRVEPFRLRVMPGTVMTTGTGAVLTWHR
jgi:hypothetical protein